MHTRVEPELYEAAVQLATAKTLNDLIVRLVREAMAGSVHPPEGGVVTDRMLHVEITGHTQVGRR
jgi:DNA-binding FadR family transcriptional regulator